MRYLSVSNRVAIRAMHFGERGSGYLEMGCASPARSTVRATTSRWTGGSAGMSGGAEGQDPACWCRGSMADRSSAAAELQGKITCRHLLGLSNPRAPPPLTVL